MNENYNYQNTTITEFSLFFVCARVETRLLQVATRTVLGNLTSQCFDGKKKTVFFFCFDKKNEFFNEEKKRISFGNNENIEPKNKKKANQRGAGSQREQHNRKENEKPRTN